MTAEGVLQTRIQAQEPDTHWLLEDDGGMKRAVYNLVQQREPGTTHVNWTKTHADDKDLSDSNFTREEANRPEYVEEQAREIGWRMHDSITRVYHMVMFWRQKRCDRLVPQIRRMMEAISMEAAPQLKAMRKLGYLTTSRDAQRGGIKIEDRETVLSAWRTSLRHNDS